jgi:hypothetical protein
MDVDIPFPTKLPPLFLDSTDGVHWDNHEESLNNGYSSQLKLTWSPNAENLNHRKPSEVGYRSVHSTET